MPSIFWALKKSGGQCLRFSLFGVIFDFKMNVKFHVITCNFTAYHNNKGNVVLNLN